MFLLTWSASVAGLRGARVVLLRRCRLSGETRSAGNRERQKKGRKEGITHLVVTVLLWRGLVAVNRLLRRVTVVEVGRANRRHGRSARKCLMCGRAQKHVCIGG